MNGRARKGMAVAMLLLEREIVCGNHPEDPRNLKAGLAWLHRVQRADAEKRKRQRAKGVLGTLAGNPKRRPAER